MNAYRLILAYNGTHYQGWQEQPNQQAITNILQNRFFRTFFLPVTIVGASRTDAGVHALGQVAVARTELDLSVDIMQEVWNNHLPSDIVIRSIEKTENSFNPQANVEQKTYWYHVFVHRPLPFYEQFGYFPYQKFCVKTFEEALQIFVGAHDFRAFCTVPSEIDTKRTIDSIIISPLDEFGALRVAIKGKSFLRYMIRRIIGAALYCAYRQEFSIAMLENVLQSMRYKYALPTAPAKGLLLHTIIYENMV